MRSPISTPSFVCVLLLLAACSRDELKIQVLPEGRVTIEQSPHDHDVTMVFEIASRDPNVVRLLEESNVTRELLRYSIPRGHRARVTIPVPVLAKLPSGTWITVYFVREPTQGVEEYPAAIQLQLGDRALPIVVY